MKRALQKLTELVWMSISSVVCGLVSAASGLIDANISIVIGFGFLSVSTAILALRERA